VNENDPRVAVQQGEHARVSNSADFLAQEHYRSFSDCSFIVKGLLNPRKHVEGFPRSASDHGGKLLSLAAVSSRSSVGSPLVTVT
jgi:hypothetical protein